MSGRVIAKAALLLDRAARRFDIATVEVDQPQAGEVLLDIRAVGLCHSDWNFVIRDYGHPLPALLGHEFAGVVRAVGPGVSSVAPGDHVAACIVASCGRCDACLTGQSVWCRHPEVASRPEGAASRMTLDGKPVWQMQRLGGFAETTLVHESQVAPLDPLIPFDRAALLGCAVVTGMGSVIRAAQVQPGQHVVVFGAGGVGLNVVQGARLVGARTITVIDVHDGRLRLAREFGATGVVNSRDRDPVEAIAELTGEHGADHAFEVSGLPEPLEAAYASLGSDGTVHLIGLQRPGSEFSLPSSELGRGAGVRAVRMGSTNFRVDIPFYVDLYLQGRLKLDELVERTIELEAINDGYAAMAGGASMGRTVITFKQPSP
jgi:S-(hydroxymethyl)glutathione dehydrogenase / alcohol dehydrogenase